MRSSWQFGVGSRELKSFGGQEFNGSRRKRINVEFAESCGEEEPKSTARNGCATRTNPRAQVKTYVTGMNPRGARFIVPLRD